NTQGEAHLLVGTARRDAVWQSNTIQGFHDPFDGTEVRLEGASIQRLELGLPVGRQMASQVGLDFTSKVLVRDADESLNYFRFAQGPSEAGKHGDVYLDREPFGVDEHAVTV